LPLESAGLFRGACHRARMRVTRWLAMTYQPFSPVGALWMSAMLP